MALGTSYLDLSRAPYVLYGVKYKDLVSLALVSGQPSNGRTANNSAGTGTGTGTGRDGGVLQEGDAKVKVTSVASATATKAAVGSNSNNGGGTAGKTPAKVRHPCL